MIDFILETKDTNVVNIIIVANALLQQAQLLERIKQHMNTDVVNHKSDVKNAKAIIGSICVGNNTFIFCANGKDKDSTYTIPLLRWVHLNYQRKSFKFGLMKLIKIGTLLMLLYRNPIHCPMSSKQT